MSARTFSTAGGLHEANVSANATTHSGFPRPAHRLRGAVRRRTGFERLPAGEDESGGACRLGCCRWWVDPGFTCVSRGGCACLQRVETLQDGSHCMVYHQLPVVSAAGEDVGALGRRYFLKVAMKGSLVALVSLVGSLLPLIPLHGDDGPRCKTFVRRCDVDSCGVLCDGRAHIVPCSAEPFQARSFEFDIVTGCALPFFGTDARYRYFDVAIGPDLATDQFSGTNPLPDGAKPMWELDAATLAATIAVPGLSFGALRVDPLLSLAAGRADGNLHVADLSLFKGSGKLWSFGGQLRVTPCDDCRTSFSTGYRYEVLKAGPTIAGRLPNTLPDDVITRSPITSTLDYRSHQVEGHAGYTIGGGSVAPSIGIRLSRRTAQVSSTVQASIGETPFEHRTHMALAINRTEIVAGLDFRLGSRWFGRIEAVANEGEHRFASMLRYHLTAAARLAIDKATARASGCVADNDCPTGWVCETTVVGDCDSKERACVPGCRFGTRGCDTALICRQRVCKTCPCPDECEPPQSCGTPGAAPCQAPAFCRYATALGCGENQNEGICTMPPDVSTCVDDGAPVCGCDGKTYPSVCHAMAARTSIASRGTCHTAPGPCDQPTHDLPNGGFEAGNVDGWEVEYGFVDTDGTSNWSGKPSGHPEAVVIDAVSPSMEKQVSTIAPYCDKSMLRIGDLLGGRHATRVSKRVTLPSGLSTCSTLRLRWGALLEDPEHPPNQQPFFEIEVRRRRKLAGWKTIHAEKMDASGAAAAGWTDVKEPSTKDSIWYRDELVSIPLYLFEPGDEMEVRLTVTDCTEGGHGGAAFLDCFTIVDRCANGCPSVSHAVPRPFVPNVFTPDGDGKNDVWSVVDINGACSISAMIRDRWGRRAWQTTVGLAGGQNASAALWDGIRENGQLGDDTVFYYILTLKGCSGTHELNGFFHLIRGSCRSDPTGSAAKTRKFKFLAKRDARKSWKGKVRDTLGDEWTKWSKARDRSISCYKSSKKWTCTASGRPCKK